VRLLLTFLLCGCTITDRYVVSAQSAQSLQQLPEAERASAAVPATNKKGKRTYLRASTIQWNDARASGTDLEVTARAPSPMMAAGSALTWIGTGISLVGTALFFAFQSGSDPYWAGAGLALFAEAIMWIGTGLWIVAAGKRPQEVAPGRADLRYLP
jgi:hypothetical protein